MCPSAGHSKGETAIVESVYLMRHSEIYSMSLELYSHTFGGVWVINRAHCGTARCGKLFRDFRNLGNPHKTRVPTFSPMTAVGGCQRRPNS